MQGMSCMAGPKSGVSQVTLEQLLLFLLTEGTWVMKLDGLIRKPAEPLGHTPNDTELPLGILSKDGTPGPIPVRFCPGNSLGSAPLSCVALNKSLCLSDPVLDGYRCGGHTSSIVILGFQ